MIILTGDTNGDQNRILQIEQSIILKENDTLIICGDFGYLFKNDKTEQLFLDLLNQRGYTICFLDGNHENFPTIYSYPVETWNKGKVHKIRDNILHLI